MNEAAAHFCVNSYSYTLDYTASETVGRLAGQGFKAIELMMYPGHLWPADIDAAGRRDLRRTVEDNGIEITSINMPNIDLNVAAATAEMRDYTLKLLLRFVELAGDLGAPFVIVGPGKANPLFAPRREELIGHLRSALDRLCPAAKRAGTKILLENMPFAFLPSARELLQSIEDYGDPDLGVIYDIANGHFIGQDPCEELRLLKGRLELVHLSDTGRSIYKHDPIGMGDVPFSAVAAVLPEIGYRQRPVLEVISRSPDADMGASAARLATMGYA